jgi:hypothetical protein
MLLHPSLSHERAFTSFRQPCRPRKSLKSLDSTECGIGRGTFTQGMSPSSHGACWSLTWCITAVPRQARVSLKGCNGYLKTSRNAKRNGLAVLFMDFSLSLFRYPVLWRRYKQASNFLVFYIHALILPIVCSTTSYHSHFDLCPL